MAFNYDTIQSYINDKLLPEVANAIFKTRNPLAARLVQNQHAFNDVKIKVPVEYAAPTDVRFLARGGRVAPGQEEISTNAEFTPAMLSGQLTLYEEDELENDSSEQVRDLLRGRTRNVQRKMEEFFADYFFRRASGGSAAAGDLQELDAGILPWNTLDHLVDDNTDPDLVDPAGTVLSNQDPGGIRDSTIPSWWLSQVVDLSSGYTGDATIEADLVNPDSDVYLPKLLAQGLALSSVLEGSDGKLIVCPQYIWDLLEGIWDPQKNGSPMNLKVGDVGFTALFYRGIPIVGDDHLVANQTGDTDGRIYVLDTNYLYLALHTRAAFRMGSFAQAPGENAKTALINAYGNVICTNRQAQVSLQGVRSPKSYVNA